MDQSAQVLIRQTFTIKVRVQTHNTRERITFKKIIQDKNNVCYVILQCSTDANVHFMPKFVNIINIKPTDNEHLRTTSVVFAYRNGKKKT